MTNQARGAASVQSSEKKGEDPLVALNVPASHLIERLTSGELFNSREITALWDQVQNLRVGEIDVCSVERLRVLAQGDPLRSTPRFGLKYENGILEYCQIGADLDRASLNPQDCSGPLFSREIFDRCIATVVNPKLMSPHAGLLETLSPDILEKLLLLEKEQQRIMRVETPYGPLITTTHSDVDGRTWAPNIDTIFGAEWVMDKMKERRNPISLSAEIGVGSGLHSIALLAAEGALQLRNALGDVSARMHVITDILPEALNCASRNITPYLRGANLERFIGKGVERLGELGVFDLIVCNPPYLPHPRGRDSVDRYSGTGLIRELFEYAPKLLNRDNPESRIEFQASSVSEADIQRYSEEFPNVHLALVSKRVEVPLRFYDLHGEALWIEYLKERGLREYNSTQVMPLHQRYWHEIMMWELSVAN